MSSGILFHFFKPQNERIFSSLVKSVPFCVVFEEISPWQFSFFENFEKLIPSTVKTSKLSVTSAVVIVGNQGIFRISYCLNDSQIGVLFKLSFPQRVRQMGLDASWRRQFVEYINTCFPIGVLSFDERNLLVEITQRDVFAVFQVLRLANKSQYCQSPCLP